MSKGASILDITKYTSYFHDGSLLEVNNHDNNIVLLLESAEIDPKEIENTKILSKSKTLFGRLCLTSVKIVKLNHKIFNTNKIRNLYKQYDDGEILDLEVHPNEILLLIAWANFPPKPHTNDVSRIEIQAEDIYWENMPWKEGYKLHKLQDDP